MKILVLGTSNSILKNGYISGMKRALTSALWTNLSSGASPGIQFAKYAHMDFSVYDIVLFDSVPNDEQYGLQTRGYTYDEAYRGILYELLSTISAQTRLVIIGISVIDFHAKPSTVYTDRELFSRLINAQFVDFSKALMTYKYREGHVYSEHPAHPKIMLAESIGFYLGNAIQHFYSHWSKGQACKNFSENFKVSTEHLSNESMPIKYFKNSLTEGKFLVMKPGDEIGVQSSHDLIGFQVNSLQTSAVIKLSTDQDKYLHMSLFYERRSDGFLSLFVPLSGFQKICCIRVQNDDEQDKVNPSTNLQPRMTHKFRDNGEVALQIGDLLYWRNDGECRVEHATPSTMTQHLRLDTYVQQKVIDEVLMSLNKTYENSSFFKKVRHYFLKQRFKRRNKASMTN